FQHGANRIRDWFVLGRVADENVVCHEASVLVCRATLDKSNHPNRTSEGSSALAAQGCVGDSAEVKNGAPRFSALKAPTIGKSGKTFRHHPSPVLGTGWVREL